MVFCVNKSSSSFPTVASSIDNSHVVFESSPASNAFTSSFIFNGLSSTEQFNGGDFSCECWWLNENFICGGKTLMLLDPRNFAQKEEQEQRFLKRLF